MVFRRLALLFIFLGLAVTARADWQIFVEPHAGFSASRYHRSETQAALGPVVGMNIGLNATAWSFGLGIFSKYFQMDDFGTHQSYTNFPIGLFGRYNFREYWRLHAGWNWDDVLYSDFRPKFMDGFKIPKDYDVAYEGPGSWVAGLGYRLSERIFWNQYVSWQSFGSFKCRRPHEQIGAVAPPIQMLTFSTTLSWSL